MEERHRYRSILLFGMPGSGKGTQGAVLGQLPALVHFSMGDIFRKIPRTGKFGREIEQYTSRGLMVPDDLTVRIFVRQLDVHRALNQYVSLSGPRAAGRAGVQAERHAWPDPRRPILTYVLPIGEAPADAPELVSAQEPASARTELEAPMEPTTLPQPSAKTVATPISAAPGNPTPPGLPVLDFYLSRARLARRGFKVLVVLDRFEMPLTRAWEPVRLSRAKAGRHHISVDLLDRMGLKVHGALNQTDRTFHVK